mmetsp:Transcript_40503/g.41334  ORF Transcript_40503/g.41334 Transcript_40503/m.41334 type:complete len:234 (-) Transcript_40503:129-830(-)|eukprot:CAMPEP_0182446492 /NCGR_PEP_ID=MMETSP1172-20130603/4233_1 /TAXON_ID=708627 /ORGANISM="Timspurckia oligopyrenoides, Strain CCMP3278" /LENGTH=233 /DNA_ID=CAMNT_0024642429 /DNA_START=74 /DNA_END=775 /DNA_ORIENTATION=-
MKVTFEVEVSSGFQESETYRIVGNLPSLGTWNPAIACVLSSEPESYVLTAEIDVEDTVDVIEYKYVVSDINVPKTVRWENGQNRVIHLVSQQEVSVRDTAFQSGCGRPVECENLVDVPNVTDSFVESYAELESIVSDVTLESVSTKDHPEEFAHEKVPVKVEKHDKKMTEEVQPQIIRVFSLPFFNPMTEEEKEGLKMCSRLNSMEKPPGFFVFDGIGRLFTKPVVVNMDQSH